MNCARFPERRPSVRVLPPASARLAGRTLIELMVALALGALLLAGVAAVFVASNQSSRIATGLSGAEESGQVALALLGQAVRRAGYSEIVGKTDILGKIPRGLLDNLVYDGPPVGGCTNVAPSLSSGPSSPTARQLRDFLVALTCSSTTTTSDVLAVWFQADNVVAAPQGAARDCTGSAAPSVAAGAIARDRATTLPLVRNVYYLSNGSLVCEGSGNLNQPQTLLDSVDEFKVFYGFDETAYEGNTDENYRPTASKFHTAAEINAFDPDVRGTSPWNFVTSVYVCVVVRSAETGTAAGATTTYQPCPTTAGEIRTGTTAISIPADGAQRRRYAQTLALRTQGAPMPNRGQ